jgi:hypothetical protein
MFANGDALVATSNRYGWSRRLSCVRATLETDEEHRLAKLELRRALAGVSSAKSPNHDCPAKNVLRYRHRLAHGRRAGVCKQCWAPERACVCGLTGAPRALPPGVELAVWVSYDEWALTSNTGYAKTCLPLAALLHY